MLENILDRLLVGVDIVAEHQHHDAGKCAGDDGGPADQAADRVPFERALPALRSGGGTRQEREVAENGDGERDGAAEDRACAESERDAGEESARERGDRGDRPAPAESGKADRKRCEIEQDASKRGSGRGR